MFFRLKKTSKEYQKRKYRVLQLRAIKGWYRTTRQEPDTKIQCQTFSTRLYKWVNTCFLLFSKWVGLMLRFSSRNSHLYTFNLNISENFIFQHHLGYELEKTLNELFKFFQDKSGTPKKILSFLQNQIQLLLINLFNFFYIYFYRTNLEHQRTGLEHQRNKPANTSYSTHSNQHP